MPLLRWHTEADGARTVSTNGIARSGGGRAEAAKPAYRVPPGTCTTGHEKHQNLEKTWRTSSKTRRIFIASDPGRRPHSPRRDASDTRRGVHEHDAARAGRPARPAGAPVARDPPARGAPTPHPRTRHPRHTTPGPVTSPHTRPPTAARPRATRVPVRRRPHAHPPRTAIAIRARPPTHGHAGRNRLRSVPSAAVAPARSRRPAGGRRGPGARLEIAC